MSNKQKEQISESIALSVKTKDYNGENNKRFTTENVPYTKLESTFKKYNYSPIQWNPTRCKANFVSATGFMVDIDEGKKIEEIEKLLNEKNVKFFLITSKSHTNEHHKFHVLLPFEKSITDYLTYEDLAKKVYTSLFPYSDPRVTEAARFYYGSPDDAFYLSNYETAEKYIDNIVDHSTHAKIAVKPTEAKTNHKSDAWDDDLEVELADGSKVKAIEIGSKQSIKCPFHIDSNPSAFIDYSAKNAKQYIHCSSCNTTFWQKDSLERIKVKCEGFWSVRSTVCKSDIVGDEFSLQDVGRDKFYIFTDAISKEEKGEHLKYVVKNNHIHNVKRVDNQLDMNADKSHYHFNRTESVFEVFIAPTKHAGIKDNKFIEDYLEETFGIYNQFMKEWLAVYFYTNYRKLPYLILKGERETGKNTFAESIADMFPTLSEIPKDLTGNFNSHVEKKLLIIDETLEGGKVQYQTLKKLSGQGTFTVNKKFQQPYSVRNNLNLIFLSNEHLPIFVEREELPKDEKNNQFFVYKMPNLKNGVDADFKDKLRDRWYQYIKTELKTVFDNLNRSDKRYSINVPITDEEKILFQDNISELDMIVDKVVEAYVIKATDAMAHLEKYITKEIMPNKFVEEYSTNKYDTSTIVKALKNQNYIVTDPNKQIKVTYCETRVNGNQISSKMKAKIAEAINAKQSKPKSHRLFVDDE